MLLSLFGVFLALSLVLVALGLFVQEHTELSLIGFTFLFLLSIHIIGSGLTVQSGVKEIYTYGDNVSGVHLDSLHPNDNFTKTIDKAEDALLFCTNKTYTYSPITLGGNLDHLFGYYLAVLSIVGFLGVMTSYKRQTWRNEDL